MRKALAFAFMALAECLPALATPALPGPLPDGTVLLHNQLRIQPAGRQVELGNFPLGLAVHPSGRFAAVLHCGTGDHSVQVVDLQSGTALQPVPLSRALFGIAFTSDGRKLVCSGGSDNVLDVFDFENGRLGPARQIRLEAPERHCAVAGLALDAGGERAFAAQLFASRIVAVDLRSGSALWTARLDSPGTAPVSASPGNFEAGDLEDIRSLVRQSDPLDLVFDPRGKRIYASLWGASEVAVIDASDGRILGRWAAGLHPNELALSPDGRRLFVSNGGLNTVTELDTATGSALETLNCAFSASEPPGSMPNSVALSADGRCLAVANGGTNDLALFDVAKPGAAAPIGFIPTGWFPSSVRLVPSQDRLLVLCAKGSEPRSNSLGGVRYTPIATLYRGTLEMIDLPKAGVAASLGVRSRWNQGSFLDALGRWSEQVAECRPAPPAAPPAGSPIPGAAGGHGPISHVIYIIKENRTYDQVLGDIAGANGDPQLCLFGRAVTPNAHELARQFVLLDNFYANADVSAAGHEWSTAGLASEFVEKLWPPSYKKGEKRIPYPSEGFYEAALPANGYLWDRAARAGITYRDYGEFVVGKATAADPSTSNLKTLVGHVDPLYRGWDLAYSDLDRAARFISELRRFEGEGAMPALQILRLPNDHTHGASPGALRPRAMVAQNDLALGRIVEAVSRSRFWGSTAIFVVEDDAQSGPDHVDAHRTTAFVVSPYSRKAGVDSSPYTTCSMLATIERLLALEPMSQFDAQARPMFGSFRQTPDLAPYAAVPAEVDLQERNPAGTRSAALSERMEFGREDANDDRLFTRVVWGAERGDAARVPAPVRAAFVRSLGVDDDD